MPARKPDSSPAAAAAAETVFVIDDDRGVRESLRLLLATLGYRAEVHESATSFLEGFDGARPGCMLLDVRMPGMSGLELQRELTARDSVLPVIFISGHGDIPMAVDAMKSGAFDFVQKPFREQELVETVQRALAENRERRARRQEREAVRARIETLTPREREVFQHITRGKANKRVAADLGLSQRTVEIHRAHVMEKMGATSLAQLVRMSLLADQ